MGNYALVITTLSNKQNTINDGDLSIARTDGLQTKNTTYY